MKIRRENPVLLVGKDTSLDLAKELCIKTRCLKRAINRRLIYDCFGDIEDFGSSDLYKRNKRYPKEVREVALELFPSQTRSDPREVPATMIKYIGENGYEEHPRHWVDSQAELFIRDLLKEFENRFRKAMSTYRWKEKNGKDRDLPCESYLLSLLRETPWVKLCDEYGEFLSCGKCVPRKLTWEKGIHKEIIKQYRNRARKCRKFKCACGLSEACSTTCSGLCLCVQHREEGKLLMLDFPKSLSDFVNRHLCQKKDTFWKYDCFFGTCTDCQFTEFNIHLLLPFTIELSVTIRSFKYSSAFYFHITTKMICFLCVIYF